MGGIAAGDKTDESKAKQRRRARSKQERRQIVEETLKPDASVSLVARAHDVNANQLFKWRKLYREGRLDLKPASNSANKLLPVKICNSLQPASSTTACRPPKVRRPGIIDIDLGHARVRIEGAADPDCIRAAVEGLLR